MIIPVHQCNTTEASWKHASQMNLGRLQEGFRNELSIRYPLTDLPQPSLQFLLHTSTTPRKTALSSISIIFISQTRQHRTEVLDNRPADLTIGEKSICRSPNQATHVTHSIDTLHPTGPESGSCNPTRPSRHLCACKKQVATESLSGIQSGE